MLVFPAPVSPTRPIVLPRSSAKLTWFTACTTLPPEWYSTERSSTSSTGQSRRDVSSTSATFSLFLFFFIYAPQSFSRGSSASRRPSPIRLMLMAVSTMAKPGMSVNHGALRIYARDEEMMAPHSGVGCCTPKPMKE